MIALTRKTDYALVALAYLGQRRLAGAGAVSARRIADQFNLPLPLLMNILKELNQAKIVVSVRGSQGGYALAQEPETIRLTTIIEAMEGPARLTACALGTPPVPTDDAATPGIAPGIAPGVTPGGTPGSTADVSLATGDASEQCALISTCPVREPLRRLNHRIHQFFQMTTLADLLDDRIDPAQDPVPVRIATAVAQGNTLGGDILANC